MGVSWIEMCLSPDLGLNKSWSSLGLVFSSGFSGGFKWFTFFFYSKYLPVSFSSGEIKRDS